ncbi:hypothetical protein D3C78_1785750 [compost metagenome]
MSFSFLNQLIWKDRQNLRSHISHNQSYFGWVDIELLAQFLALLSHFPNKLDTCKAGTNDNES